MRQVIRNIPWVFMRWLDVFSGICGDHISMIRRKPKQSKQALLLQADDCFNHGHCQRVSRWIFLRVQQGKQINARSRWKSDENHWAKKIWKLEPIPGKSSKRQGLSFLMHYWECTYMREWEKSPFWPSLRCPLPKVQRPLLWAHPLKVL
jgi:hypothetical protein